MYHERGFNREPTKTIQVPCTDRTNHSDPLCVLITIDTATYNTIQSTHNAQATTRTRERQAWAATHRRVWYGNSLLRGNNEMTITRHMHAWLYAFTAEQHRQHPSQLAGRRAIRACEHETITRTTWETWNTTSALTAQRSKLSLSRFPLFPPFDPVPP